MIFKGIISYNEACKFKEDIVVEFQFVFCVHICIIMRNWYKSYNYTTETARLH